MFLQQTSRALRRQGPLAKGLRLVAASTAARRKQNAPSSRGFHATRNLKVVKPYLLADIGEGIVECEIIQWFVEPEARVEEFSPLCEVQSDKASVEITSRFAGVVKKLHYEAGEMAKVGKPLVDIDIQGDAKEEDLKSLTPTEPETKTPEVPLTTDKPAETTGSFSSIRSEHQDVSAQPASNGGAETAPPAPKGKHAALATPAVRHLSKELDVDITEIHGTGREGRVSKEDIYKFVEAKKNGGGAPPAAGAGHPQPTPLYAIPHTPGKQQETRTPLTKTQEQMFKTMTRSLNIPHFLYADEIDFTNLVELRRRLNKVLAKTAATESGAGAANTNDVTKLSYLPFIIKAVSMSLYKHPILNARVDIDPATSKPSLAFRSQHNIGVAMDTPQGLLVPVVKDVANLNVLSIARELVRLQGLAHAGKLSPQDMSGGTITVSNIGNIGGTYLSPVIVEKEVAILGIGRMRTVPAFDEEGRVVRKEICNFSWSADHRVVDGATLARAAQVVRGIVEEPDVMVMHLR
ncbi:2-oxoacid dehydrogenases acyltransferase-domain-containing protein [Coniochaeta sp. 2T2.1]|nr:2-oxoacid dehydrogenases acyltransferase-domain-containing protein [Coniochaeta sp. 2T2.1]